jgi:hypothetical protein
MNHIPTWQPGDAVVLRGRGFGFIWWAVPARVVQDTRELVALYWCAGTPWKVVPRHPTGREILAATRVDLLDKVWSRTNVLMLKKPTEAHSIWLMWEAEHKLDCWYVNLETPLRRTPLGFELMDHELDIVIQPDRMSWRWKDMPAFEEMLSAGLFSPAEGHAIRAEGLRVIHKLQANASPFCDGWENWSPPADWEIPTLPPGWDSIA